MHLVLARLPDAPPGPKGLSLFLVPKFYANGHRSAVVCERIEEKMGLHGSPTCVMRFDEATGWIVGEPGKGLNAMFVMMNAARLHVALQGIGLLDAAWQKADAYSKERRQMRAPGARDTSLIQDHPAMRRILDTQRAWIDGGRVLAYRTALELDLLKHHPDAARRDAAQRWCSLVTPVHEGRLHAPGVPRRQRMPAGVRRPRLRARMGHRADRARRARGHDLRGHQRNPGDRPAGAQGAGRRRHQPARAC